MTTYDEIFTAAKSLPPAERLRLVDAIHGTISPDEWPLELDDPLDECEEEMERRLDDIEAGRVTTLPWSEAREQVLREIGLDG